MRARVYVTLKREVLDPQGEAVRKGLTALGFPGVGEVRVGRVVDIELDATGRDPEALAVELRGMADKLLANPVIEDYRVELDPPAGA